MKKKENGKVGRPRLADKDTKKKAVISILVSLLIVVVLVVGGTFALTNVFDGNNLKGTTTTENKTLEGFSKTVNNFDDLVSLGYDTAFENVIEVNDGLITLLNFEGTNSSITIDNIKYSASDYFVLFKYSDNGSLIWKKAYEKSSDASILNMVSLGKDSFVVLGIKNNNIHFYKMDSNGNILMKNEEISVANLDSSYTFENCISTVNSDMEIINVTSVLSSASKGFVVSKLKEDSTVISSNYIECNDEPKFGASEIIIDNDNNIVFSGYSDESSYIVKTNGNKFEKFSLDMVEKSEFLYSIAFDQNGYYVLSVMPRDISNCYSKLIKLDSNLSKVEDIILNNEVYAKIAISSLGNVYVASMTFEQDNYYLTISKNDSNFTNIWKKVDYEDKKGIDQFIVNDNEKMIIAGSVQTKNGIPFASLSTYKKIYNVTSEVSNYGDVTINNSKTEFGQQVMFSIVPKDEYLVGDVKILNTATGDDVTNNVNYNSSNNTFVMPGYDVKIVVTYTLTSPVTTTSNKDNKITTTKVTTTTKATTTLNSTTKNVSSKKVTTIKNPKTYDNVFVYVIFGVIGVIILVFSISFFRKIRKK